MLAFPGIKVEAGTIRKIQWNIFEYPIEAKEAEITEAGPEADILTIPALLSAGQIPRYQYLHSCLNEWMFTNFYAYSLLTVLYIPGLDASLSL